MASRIPVSCPRLHSVLPRDAYRSVSAAPLARVSLQGFKERKFHVLTAKAHVATIESSSNSSPLAKILPEIQSSVGKDVESENESTIEENVVSYSEISAFMAEVSNLIKLVDSRDITELQLKRNDCELIIRKKEALQPAPAASFMMPPPQSFSLPQPQASHNAPSPPPPTSAPSLPAPKTSKSSIPPFKCPMAGTFYRCPGPGEPPFVKVGDKVKKGQVVCIIEAMKLMNEIEADQSGTVVEVIAEDGKPVSIDTPLFIIGS